MAEPLDRLRERRLQPLGRAHAALVAEQVRAGPARILFRSQLTCQTYCLRVLICIRVTLFNQAHRQAVGAEDEMNPRTVRELPQNGADALNERVNVQGVIVETVDGVYGGPAVRLFIDPAPFL